MPFWSVMWAATTSGRAASNPSRSRRRMCLDAVAHRRQLGFPLGPQVRVGEYGRGQSSTVGRRVRVVRPHDDLELAEHSRRFVGVGAHDGQRADPLAVEAEVLRERARDEHRNVAGGEGPHGGGIGVDPGRESLVGHVEQRDQPALDHHRAHLFPLLGGQVHPGRVVTTGVEHDDRAGLGLAEGRQHPVGIDGRGCRGRSTDSSRPGTRPG